MKIIEASLLIIFLHFTVNSQTITAYTINLAHGRGTDNNFNYQRQIDAFSDADIVFVQERSTGEVGWNSPLASAGMAEAVYRENGHGNDGPAIWYRTSTVTINQTYNHALSTGFIGWNGSQNVDKAVVAAKVTVHGKQFYVVSTHLCWSACADSNGSTFSAQRVAQATELLNWINSTLTGGLDILIGGDLNFAPNYPKSPSGLQKDVFTADYTDLWNAGISANVAFASWGDRDSNSQDDMPVSDLGTRTADSRRIDYFFLKNSSTTLSLKSISVPDSRYTCSTTLTSNGTFKECPDVLNLFDIPDDQGIRYSDHNAVRVVLNVKVSSLPVINNISRIVTCDTSILVNFNTSVPSHAYIEYGLTTSYGSSTIDDTARFFREHAIPITGLSPNTSYNYRVIATSNAGTTTGSNQTFTTTSNGINCPALPILIDSRMPDMVGAVEQTVKSSGGDYTPSQFQSALDTAKNATGKRIITIDAGLTLTGSFTLGNKVDNNWIIVRTSAYASLPEGKRVNPSQISSFVKIENTNTEAPIKTEASAHHWRLIGIEVTINPSALADAPEGFQQNGLIRIGTGSETSESQWPHDIVIDRCYVHGQPLKNTNRGIRVDGTDVSIIDSYLSEFHSVGADAQAILASQCRRVKMVNNYIESAGENFLAGGVGHTVIPVTTPTDFEFTHNFVTWKESWKTNHPSWDGKNWATKNHWEIKTGKRSLVVFNIFDKWWSSEQTGGSIALKSSDNDKDPTVVCSDIVWFLNWHKNQGTGISINGSNWPDEESTDYTRRIWFIHNLFEINGDIWDDENTGNSSEASMARIAESVVDEGGGIFRKQYPDDLLFVHNTFTNAFAAQSSRQIHALSDIPTTNGKMENFTVQDNIVGYGIFGIKISGTAEGVASLDLGSNSSTRVWSSNLIAGSSTNYPTGNTYVNNFDAIKFISFGNGLGGNYRLSFSSTGKNTASDGTDKGVNVEALERATFNTFSGDWTTDIISIVKKCNWHASPRCNQ